MKYFLVFLFSFQLFAAPTNGIGRIVKIDTGGVNYFLVIRDDKKEYYWPLVVKNKKQLNAFEKNKNKIIHFEGKAVIKDIMILEQSREVEMFQLKSFSPITLSELKIPNDISEKIKSSKEPVYLTDTQNPQQLKLTVNNKTVIASIITALAANALITTNDGGAQSDFQQNAIGSLILTGGLYYAGKNLIKSADIDDGKWQLQKEKNP